MRNTRISMCQWKINQSKHLISGIIINKRHGSIFEKKSSRLSNLISAFCDIITTQECKQLGSNKENEQ